jgi:hypothetical protein
MAAMSSGLDGSKTVCSLGKLGDAGGVLEIAQPTALPIEPPAASSRGFARRVRRSARRLFIRARPRITGATGAERNRSKQVAPGRVYCGIAIVRIERDAATEHSARVLV